MGYLDIEGIRSQVVSQQQYVIVWTALLYWDWLALLPLEYKYIWKARWTWLKLIFLLNRYGVLMWNFFSMAMIFATVSKDLCGKTFWFQTYAFIYAIIISDVLLAIRVWALYNRSRKVTIWSVNNRSHSPSLVTYLDMHFPRLCLLLTVELVFMVAVGSETGPVEIPDPIAAYLGLSGCLVGAYRGQYPRFAYMLSCAPFAVNTILLSMVVYKSWSIARDIGAQLPILKRMIQDGASYFLVITLSNFINVYFYAQPDQTLKVFNVCTSVVLGSTLSCRLTLSLHQDKPSVPAFAPLPAFSHTSARPVAVHSSHRPRIPSEPTRT
ncbi:hypothetical protein JCM5353_006502 [Sporobolomyces roseus]